MADSKRGKGVDRVKLPGGTQALHEACPTPYAEVEGNTPAFGVHQSVAAYEADVTHETNADAQAVMALKARRMAALSETFGLFKDKNVFPSDGLVFERESREEW